MVRLGTGGLDGRPLTSEARAVGLDTIVRFKRLADSHAVDEVVAVATSAVREAPNGGEFLAEIARRAGIAVRVISGLEEARLIYRAAIYGVEATAGTSVVIDIGGGTTEIALGNAAGMQVCRSLKLGVIRLTERFVRTDPLSGGNERRLVSHIREEAGEYLERVRAAGIQRVIGTSGTWLNLGEMALHGIATDSINHARVPASALHRLRKQLVASDMRERLRVPALDSRRSDVIVAGAVVADTIVRLLGASEITLCDFAATRRARARLHRAQPPAHRTGGPLPRHPPAQRRRARRALRLVGGPCASRWRAWRCRSSTRPASIHGSTIARASGSSTRRCCTTSACTSATSATTSTPYYLIKNGGLRGFEPDEIEAIALVARYHRRAAPKKSHDAFAALTPGASTSRARRVGAAAPRRKPGPQPRAARRERRVAATSGRTVRPAAARERRTTRTRSLGRDAPGGASRDARSASRIEIDSGDDRHAEHTDHTARVPGKPVRRRGHRRIGQDHAARPAGEVAGRPAAIGCSSPNGTRRRSSRRRPRPARRRTC